MTARAADQVTSNSSNEGHSKPQEAQQATENAKKN
jgi:hypothetical protein